MATITKRHWKTAAGVERSAWIVSYSAAGKRHIKTLPSKREAEDWKTETLHEIARGIHTPPTASVTVAEAGERWIEQCRTDGLEATTMRQYRQHLDLHIVPVIGEVKLAHLSPASVIDFRNVLIKQKRSRALASKVIVSLGAILGTAMAAGLVARNVVRDQASGHAKRQRRLEKRHDKRLEVGVDIPTKDEIRALLATAQGRWRPMIVTVIFTGLRASELRGLRWSDVELGAGAGSLHVRQRADRFNSIGSPKSNAGKRTVPLAPMVVNTLKEWRLACPKGELGLVFPNLRGGVESLHAMSGGLGAAQKLAGLGGSRRAPRYGMHAFRHAAASLLIDQGVSPKRVQAIMGHSSIGVTFDVYGHLFPDAGEDAAAMALLQQALIGAA
jgi:integrase